MDEQRKEFDVSVDKEGESKNCEGNINGLLEKKLKLVIAIISLLVIIVIAVVVCLSPKPERSIPADDPNPAVETEEEKESQEYTPKSYAENILASISQSIQDGEPSSFGSQEFDGIYSENSDDEFISSVYNLSNALTAGFYLYQSSTVNADDLQESFNGYIALVNVDLFGKHKETILSYIEQTIGIEEYERIRKNSSDINRAIQMTAREKSEILNYFHQLENEVYEKEYLYSDEELDEQLDLVWKETCEKYSISENDMMELILE